jgi:hypothetical protein
VAAYYFCFTTMTTVGYGDIFPYSNSERIMCIFLQICGGFVMAWVIASLTSIVTSVDANAAFASARMEGVASYVAKMQVPEDLGRRIRRHFRHFFENKSSLDESTIMMEMSTALRQELTDFLVLSGPMSEVALFKSMSSVYWARVLPLLRPCMFARLETVCKQGEDCVEGYIVTEGCLTGATLEEAASTEYGREKLSAQHRPEGHKSPRAEQFGLPTGKSFMARQEDALVGSATQLMVHGGKAVEFEPEAARRLAAFHARVVQLRNLEVALDDDQVLRSASRVARQSQEPAEADTEYMLDVDARLHLRVLVAGGMVNTLAVVKVWGRCLETVQATEKTDCYALSADLFHNEFKDDGEVWRQMQEHMVDTQFKMDRHSERALDARSDEAKPSSEWGVPLYMYAETEQEQHEAEYLKKQYKQRKIAARAKIRALRGSAAQ